MKIIKQLQIEMEEGRAARERHLRELIKGEAEDIIKHLIRVGGREEVATINISRYCNSDLIELLKKVGVKVTEFTDIRIKPRFFRKDLRLEYSGLILEIIEPLDYLSSEPVNPIPEG